MGKSLTASEIERGWKDSPHVKWMDEMQEAFLLPIIEKVKDILRKDGIEIPKELE